MWVAIKCNFKPHNPNNSYMGSKSSNHHLPVRIARYKSIDSLRRSIKLWNCLLFSMPLDLILYQILSSNRITQKLFSFEAVTIVLAAITLTLVIFLFINITETYLKVKKLQGVLTQIKEKNYYWIIVLMLAAVPIIDLLRHTVKVDGAISWIVAIAVVTLSIFGITKESIAERKAEKEAIDDKVIWVERANHELFIFTIMPIICARSLSLVALIQYLINPTGAVYYLPYFIGSLILLLYFKPTWQNFIDNCPRCSMLTSIVIREIGSCPACDREQYAVKIPEPEIEIVAEQVAEKLSLSESKESSKEDREERFEQSNFPRNLTSRLTRYGESLLSLIKLLLSRGKENHV